MQTFIFVLSTLIAVNHGQKLKLSLEDDVGRWTFKGFGSYDFNKGWGGGVGVGFRFKRSADDVPRSYNIVIQANQCLFDVYDENGDGIITLEEMTKLFEDKTLGRNLFEDLYINKEHPGITKSDFYDRVPLVIKGCLTNGS